MNKNLKNIVKYLLLAVRSIPADFKSTCKKEFDILLICNDGDRGIKIENKLYSPIMDSFRERAESWGYKTCTFASPYSSMVGKVAFNNPFSLNLLFLLDKLLHTRFFINKFKKILLSSKCKLIISIDTNKEYLAAARQAQIPVAEIMHGWGYTSFAYRGWDVVSNQPDFFIAYDEVTIKSLREVTNPEKIIAVNHIWLERFKDSLFVQAIAQNYIKPILRKKLKSFHKTIVYAAEWGYDSEVQEFEGIIDNGVMHDSVNQAIKNTTKDVQWIIKPHPIQLRNPNYRRHIKFFHDLEKKNANVIMEEAKEIPTQLLLTFADGVITMSSMTSYDAAFLGVPSLGLCPCLKTTGMYRDYYKDIENEGFFTRGELNTESIIVWIKKNAQKKRESFNSLKKTDDLRKAIDERILLKF